MDWCTAQCNAAVLCENHHKRAILNYPFRRRRRKRRRSRLQL